MSVSKRILIWVLYFATLIAIFYFYSKNKNPEKVKVDPPKIEKTALEFDGLPTCTDKYTGICVMRPTENFDAEELGKPITEIKVTCTNGLDTGGVYNLTSVDELNEGNGEIKGNLAAAPAVDYVLNPYQSQVIKSEVISPTVISPLTTTHVIKNNVDNGTVAEIIVE